MVSVSNFKTWLFPILLILSLTICGNAFPQSERFRLEIDLPDLKEWDKQTQEYPILKNLVESQAKTIAELERSLALAQKERDLANRENEINEKIIAVKDMEIKALNNANDRLKEVTDRALKLAETAKPKSNNLLYIIGGILVGLVAGLAIAL